MVRLEEVPKRSRAGTLRKGRAKKLSRIEEHQGMRRAEKNKMRKSRDTETQ